MPETSSITPADDWLAALKAAALRGVDVRVLVPEVRDHWLTWLAAFTYFDELRAAEHPRGIDNIVDLIGRHQHLILGLAAIVGLARERRRIGEIQPGTRGELAQGIGQSDEHVDRALDVTVKGAADQVLAVVTLVAERTQQGRVRGCALP